MGTLQLLLALKASPLLQKSLHNTNQDDLKSFLRHDRRWSPCWQDHHGVEERCCPQDCRELPSSLHWREGVRIQGFHLPPCHPQLHVPGRRLHCWERNWRKVHLRKQVRG